MLVKAAHLLLVVQVLTQDPKQPLQVGATADLLLILTPQVGWAFNSASNFIRLHFLIALRDTEAG